MKITQILIPSAVVGAAALVLAPTQPLRAFSTIGGSLGTTQRHYRVWNNFADPKANNYVIEEDDYPGTIGAITAIRKGAAEWGSRTHGSGLTDPTQANLGDGGANFDFFYAGEADNAGGSNSNILSALSGVGGGVLAFMQGPISNGWTIKFYDGDVEWADGASAIGPGKFDIQGVAAHELGHALGLGHSGTGSATMAPSIGFSSISERSIEPDDIAGVQFIYGVASNNKPRIDDVQVTTGGVVTITGANFSNNGNEVWFTDRYPASGINVVSNVSSSGGGSVITLNFPANSESGDVLVKNNGSGGSSLSNTWPLDKDGPDVGPTFYCIPKTSSAGCAAMLTTSDTSAQPQSGANDYTLTANFVQGGKASIFFGGVSGTASSSFFGGLLCVKPPTFRTPIQFSGGSSPTSCDGQVSLIVNTGIAVPAGTDAGPGNQLWMQLWYRDPANGDGNFGTSLSDAVELTFE